MTERTVDITFWAQAQHKGEWVILPGFSSTDLEEVIRGVRKLRDLNQKVRILKYTTTTVIEEMIEEVE